VLPRTGSPGHHQLTVTMGGFLAFRFIDVAAESSPVNSRGPFGGRRPQVGGQQIDYKSLPGSGPSEVTASGTYGTTALVPVKAAAGAREGLFPSGSLRVGWAAAFACPPRRLMVCRMRMAVAPPVLSGVCPKGSYIEPRLRPSATCRRLHKKSQRACCRRALPGQAPFAASLAAPLPAPVTFPAGPGGRRNPPHASASCPTPQCAGSPSSSTGRRVWPRSAARRPGIGPA
jgi:hypothetical protein